MAFRRRRFSRRRGRRVMARRRGRVLRIGYRF